MRYLLIRHQVRDFDEWKPEYDAHAGARTRAGLREEHLLHDIRNPNEVVILFEAQDESRAKDFIASADLREAMHRAGVLGQPEFHILEE